MGQAVIAFVESYFAIGDDTYRAGATMTLYHGFHDERAG